MSSIVNLNADTLRRIIQEERHKLMLEAKQKKQKKQQFGKVVPPEPKVEGGKKSSLPGKIEAANKKAKKAMSLDEAEVEADEMAGTLAKKVHHLKEAKVLEQRLRSQLRLVLEKKNGIEQDIADLL